MDYDDDYNDENDDRNKNDNEYEEYKYEGQGYQYYNEIENKKGLTELSKEKLTNF